MQHKFKKKKKPAAVSQLVHPCTWVSSSSCHTQQPEPDFLKHKSDYVQLWCSKEVDSLQYKCHLPPTYPCSLGMVPEACSVNGPISSHWEDSICMMHVKLAASNLLTIIASVPLNLASESWGFIELMIDQSYDIDVYSLWKWPFCKSSNLYKERTGYHVGNAPELEALWPAQNTGEEMAKGSSWQFSRSDPQTGV